MTEYVYRQPLFVYKHQMAISGNQLRAARALLGFDQAQVAKAAKVGVNTVRNMEAAGASSIRARTETVDAIEAFLKSAGIVFLAPNGEGLGVRFRSTPQINDDELIATVEADQIWIVRHKGVDSANSLIRALQKARDLASSGHDILSIRTPDDRVIIERDQIRRLLIRAGLWLT